MKFVASPCLLRLICRSMLVLASLSTPLVLAASSTAGQASQASEIKTTQAKLSVAQRLAREAPQDLGQQREVFSLLSHISNLQRQQGDLQNAYRTNQQALHWVEKLLQQDPEHTSLLRDQSIARERNAVILQMQGQLDLALDEFGRALQTAETIARLEASNPDFKNDIWLLQRQIAAIHKQLQRPQMAAQHFQAALVALQGIAPESAQYLRLANKLWLAHSELGESLLQTKQFESANQHLQQAWKIAERELAQAKSGSENLLHWQDALANSRFNLGQVALKQDQTESALDHLHNAQKMYQALLKQQNKQVHWHMRITQIQHHLADMAAKDRPAQELRHLQAAYGHAMAAHQLDPSQPYGQLMQTYVRLAEHHLQQKQFSDAIYYWYEIVKKLPDIPFKDADAKQEMLAELQGKIAAAHFELNQWQHSVAHYRQAMDIRQALAQASDGQRLRDENFLHHQRIQISIIEFAVGLNLIELQDLPAARQSFHSALQSLEAFTKPSSENERWQHIRAMIKGQLGTLYMLAGQHPPAWGYLTQAKEDFQKLGQTDFGNKFSDYILPSHILVETGLAEIRYAQGAWDDAAKYYAAALALSQKMTRNHATQDLRRISQRQAELHFKIGRTQQQLTQLATALSSLREAERQLEEDKSQTASPPVRLLLARTRAQIASLPGAISGLDNASRRNLIFEAQETLDFLEKHAPSGQLMRFRQEFLTILRSIK